METAPKGDPLTPDFEQGPNGFGEFLVEVTYDRVLVLDRPDFVLLLLKLSLL